MRKRAVSESAFFQPFLGDAPEDQEESLSGLLHQALQSEQSGEQWQAIHLYHKASAIIQARLAELPFAELDGPLSPDSSPRRLASGETGSFLRRNSLKGAHIASSVEGSWAPGNHINTAWSAKDTLALVLRAEHMQQNGDTKNCALVFRDASKALEQQLQRLTESGIVEERNLLMFTDTLVASAWPMAAAAPEHFLRRGTVDGHTSWRQGMLNQWIKVRTNLRSMVRLEWGIRVALSEIVCVLIVLSSSSPYLRLNPWACVLAIVCVKPTLGDTLHTSWDVLCGGLLGCLACLPVVWVPLTNFVAVFCALAVSFFMITFTLADHVQGRFALLIPLVGFWSQSSALGSSSAAAFQTVVTTLCGYALGAALGILALVLPWPRTATPQLCHRLVEGFQLASRMHAVLAIASQQREVPHVLHLRAQVVLQKLTACCESAERMLLMARWEPRSAKKWLALRQTYALLLRLTWNLQLRFNRRLVRHNAFQQSAAAVQREPLHACIRTAIACMRSISEELLHPGNDIKAVHQALLGAVHAQKLPPVDTGKPLAENSAAFELYIMSKHFYYELSEFVSNGGRPQSTDGAPRRKFKKLDSVVRHLFPAMFVEHIHNNPFPQSRAPHPVWNLKHVSGLRLRVRDAAATTLGLLLACSVAWLPDQDSLPTLIAGEELFCPIGAIFMYQARWHLLLRNKSRLWRWMLGTYLGCTFAWWSTCIAADQAWLLALCLGLSAFAGTWLHASDFVAFGGLVAAFTPPVISVPIWGKDNSTARGTARLVQSITAAACLLVARTLVPPTSAEALLKARLAASLSGIAGAVRELVWRDDADVGDSDIMNFSRRTPMEPQWQERLKRLMPEVHEQRLLLEEALEEPLLRKSPSETDLKRALESINGMWQCVLQIESMIATFGSSPETATLISSSEMQLRAPMQSVLETAEHMRQILMGADAKLPASLFQLLLAARSLEEFKPLASTSAGSLPSAMLRRKSQDLTSSADPSGMPLGAHGQDTVHDIMALGALLGRLQLLIEHTAEMAWRIVSLVQKQRPTAANAEGHADLYDFDIAL